jgi:hypothetical protein
MRPVEGTTVGDRVRAHPQTVGQVVAAAQCPKYAGRTQRTSAWQWHATGTSICPSVKSLASGRDWLERTVPSLGGDRHHEMSRKVGVDEAGKRQER